MDNIKNRHELVFWVEARNCNYNGDPDFDNLPRVDINTNLGIMTDVSIKRRLRDYVDAAFNGKKGFDIFVRNGSNLNRQIAECVIEASGDEAVEKGKKVQEASVVAKKRFWDVRTFGGVLSTGLNAGQIQGPVQFNMPMSYDVVETSSITLSPVAYRDKEYTEIEKYDEFDKTLDSNAKRTFGKKTSAAYALFECHAFISANLANKTGFSENDMNVLLEGILNMFNFQTSASKAGMQVVGPVIVFKHVGTSTDADAKAREALLGCTSAQKLFNLISVNKKDGVEFPRSYNDYNASIAISKLPHGVEVGFKYEPFAPIVWNHVDGDSDEWLKES